MVQLLAGNWQGSSIFTYAAGPWLSVTAGTDRSLTAVGNDRADVVGDWKLSQTTLQRYFNTAAFAPSASGTFGNTGRSIVRGRANWNLDVALWRSFPIRENLKADLRLEAFNVLNHSRFNNPGTALNAGPTFGVTTTALDPRILQIAMKVSF